MMQNGQIYSYLINEKYTSIYVCVEGYEQMKFYWNKTRGEQTRPPMWRGTSDDIEGCSIKHYDNNGVILDIFGKEMTYAWTNTQNGNNPHQKGLLLQDDGTLIKLEKPKKGLTWAEQRKNKHVWDVL